MLVGPIFRREAAVAPRRTRHYLLRLVYGFALILLMCTAWMLVAKTQVIRNLGDMARFGSVLFQILAPLQLALMLFMAAIRAASNIAVEKDRKTLILLLLTRLNNNELVLGKLFASLLNIGVMLITSLPIFMLIVLFGGTSFEQVGWVYAVTVITVLVAGSLGTTVALWREKTFQTLALVALVIVAWIGLAEAAALLQVPVLGLSPGQLAGAISPIRAIMAASSPTVVASWQTEVVPYLIFGGSLFALLNLIAIFRVRSWNPSRDVRPGQATQAQDASVFADGEEEATEGEQLRSGHVDDRARQADQNSREVWDNPVLWREMKTWAHGKKILFIRVAFWLLAGAVFYALWSLVSSGTAVARSVESTVYVAPFIFVLAPLMLLSLVMLNALSVSSITGERDLRSIDLLMVTDLSPKEFLFGKLGGVLYIAMDLLGIPVLMCLFLYFGGVLSLLNVILLLIGWVVLVVFVAVLGIHCGMIYPSSRQAIGVSLGTVFFLFLGIVTAMMMMVSFTGNVEAQFTPFLACIVGGGVGLYVALGSRNPSPAIAMASGILPMAMFYSITTLLLGQYVNVILVVAFTYGFATTAMIVPALGEFNISMGRIKTAGDE